MLKDKSRYELLQSLEFWGNERASMLRNGFDGSQDVQYADAQIAKIRNELNCRQFMEEGVN